MDERVKRAEVENLGYIFKIKGYFLKELIETLCIFKVLNKTVA